MTFDEKTYGQRIAALFERHQSVQSVGFSGDAYKPGLDGMAALDKVAGSPSMRLRCIHVAGTNGKGSVSSMLASALAAEGLRVGLYTSPHLLDFRERMRVVSDDGVEMIPKEDVWEYLESYEAALDGRSFFEITTGMAFWWFERITVDIAVIEVGLGGRLDSTNIITPELSIITSIGLDHCAILGDTRAKIAYEKAGIFKPGVPALVAVEDEETASVFEEVAAEVHCPLFFGDSMEPDNASLKRRDAVVPEIPDNAALERRDAVVPVTPDDAAPEGMDLTGPYQALNLRTALAALELLGIVPDMDALRNTAARTGFRGRWEKLMDSPEVICDIGHNPPALEINFARIAAMGRPVTIVYGVMADKDLAGIAPLFPSNARYILVAPDTVRALPCDNLKERMETLRPDLQTVTAPSVAEGVRQAVSQEGPGGFVYIGGSTFVVSEAIGSLK